MVNVTLYFWKKKIQHNIYKNKKYIFEHEFKTRLMKNDLRKTKNDLEKF